MCVCVCVHACCMCVCLLIVQIGPDCMLPCSPNCKHIAFAISSRPLLYAHVFSDSVILSIYLSMSIV